MKSTKLKTLIFTVVFILNSSIITFANTGDKSTNSINTSQRYNLMQPFNLSLVTSQDANELEQLTNKMLDLEGRIYLGDYTRLSVNDKANMLKDYFTVRKDIFKTQSQEIMNTGNLNEVNDVRDRINQENDKDTKDMEFINGVIEELKNKSDVSKPKEILKEVIVAYKELRDEGRKLDKISAGQSKVLNSMQITVLNKFAKLNELLGNKKDALDFYKKILNIDKGDIETISNISRMEKSSDKKFSLINNSLVEYDVPTIEQDGHVYVELSDIEKVQELTIYIDNSNHIYTIQSGKDILNINMVEKSLNFNNIKLNPEKLILNKEDKIYLPIDVLFKMFKYVVKVEDNDKTMIISKQPYMMNEIDTLLVDDIVNSIFQ